MPNGTTSGSTMPTDILPEWEQVLSAAARLQRILPESVLVGGTAVALYAQHRLSVDADHILADLRQRFDLVLAELESVAGWKTARIARPVLILGSLDGIETGVRQLIRDEPLETVQLDISGQKVTVPTEAEMLRIKAVLILKRNATRDYLDFVALANYIGREKMVAALHSFDRIYPQPNDESALQQLQIQMAQPLPYDLEDINLDEYKNLDPHWRNWHTVREACREYAALLFDRISDSDD